MAPLQKFVLHHISCSESLSGNGTLENLTLLIQSVALILEPLLLKWPGFLCCPTAALNSNLPRQTPPQSAIESREASSVQWPKATPPTAALGSNTVSNSTPISD